MSAPAETRTIRAPWSAGGLLLLLVVVALALFSERVVRRNSELEVRSGTRVVRVFSAGRGLKPAAFGDKPQHDAIVLGEWALTSPEAHDGLRVGLFDSADRLAEYRLFPPGEFTGSCDELRRWLAETPEGGCAAFSVAGVMFEQGAKPETFEEISRWIGARQAPSGTAPTSWAFVARRAGGAWQPIAEASSMARGVSIAATLEGGGGTGHAVSVVDPRRKRSLLALFDSAERQMESFIERRRIADERACDAIAASPPHGDHLRSAPDGLNRILWREMKLGAHPVFRSLVSIQDAARGRSDGVEFQVRVNGETIAALPYGATGQDTMGWQPFSADLSAFAGQTVAFELTVAPREHPSFDWAAWGDPAILDEPLAPDLPATAAGSGMPSGNGGTVRAVFLGHVYPLNGFDKRNYDQYGNWITSDPTRGQLFRARVATERDRLLLTAFYTRAASFLPQRVIWGGDSAYANSPAEFNAVASLARMFPTARQAFVPGNHDPSIANAPQLASINSIAPGSEESLAGARLMYIDAVNDGQRPMHPVTDPAMLKNGWAHWESKPTKAWIDAFVARLKQPMEESSLVLFLHHAPWLIEDGFANIGHPKNSWWLRQVHPVLADLVKGQHKTITVIAGDAGDHTLCDARTLDGVRYAACGQPRVGETVPNGFLILEWSQLNPVPQVMLYACPLTRIAPLALPRDVVLSTEDAVFDLPFAVQNLAEVWEGGV